MNRRAVLAAGGALALAGGGLATTSFADDPDTPSVPDVQLAVLDRPATATSGNLYATRVGRTLAAQRGDTVDAGSARAVTTNGTTVWVAKTSKKNICSAEVVGTRGAVATSCVAEGDFGEYGLFSETADIDGALTSVGVVPDGVSSVKLNQPDGRTVSATVKDNVVVAKLTQLPASAVLVDAKGAARTVKFGAGR